MSDASRQLDWTNEVKTPAPGPRLGSEFNAFLFSSIGEDRNGMPLTVVSLLARRDLEPWQEAAALAAMSADAATRRLDSLIRTLPAQPLTLPDSRTIATRLIALLPRGTDPKIRPEEQAKAADTGAEARRRRTVVIAVILVISTMLLMSAQLTVLHNQPPTQPVIADAPP